MTNNDDTDERKYEVVIAEDSLTQREYLKYILEKNGFVVFGGADGKEALELVKKRKPDLVISDVIMPVMNGYDFCRAIKKEARYYTIPVILLTALSDTKDVALALECGADNFITKPYDEEYLLLRIRQILSRDRVEQVKESERSPVSVAFDGETYQITSDRRQMFEFLLTAYQVAITKNLEVIKSEKALIESNDRFLVFIKEAAMRLKNPLEVVEENLTIVLNDFEHGESEPENVSLQLRIQIKNLEQIRKNIIELNKAIVDHSGEMSEASKQFLTG